jgi:hypothetical protein
VATETSVVKAIVRRIKGGKLTPSCGDEIMHAAMMALKKGDHKSGCFSMFQRPTWPGKRLRRRIVKKLAQPFRRKKRGPRRAKAAGKNGTRPRRG